MATERLVFAGAPLIASLVAGCASTIGASSATSDAAAEVDVSVGGVDVPRVDAGIDVPPEARVCPAIVERDVPSVDVPATSEPYVVEIALGLLHQCARMSDDTVRCRGHNAYGALGRGAVTWRELDAAPVPGLTGVAQVVTTPTGATCALHRDGRVRCWGTNRSGELGTGPLGDSTLCDALGPCRPSPVLVPGLSDVVQLATSLGTVCAVRGDGSVWCWGGNDALLPDGGSPTPMRAAAIANVARLWRFTGGWITRAASGHYRSYSIGPQGRLAVDVPREAEIEYSDGAASPWHLCYRLPDGSARCLGNNDRGQLGNGSTTSDRVFTTEPVDPGLCGVRSITVGVTSSCALMADDTAQCWGDGETRPAPVAGLDEVTALFPGYQGQCARRRDRSVWCWGRWSPYVESPALARVEW